MSDYTQLFDRLIIRSGVVPEFPFDLLSPDLDKKLKSRTWPHCSKAMIYSHQPKPQIEFVTDGDYVTVPMFGVAAEGATRLEVEAKLKANINDYCMEMIQCEQEYSFSSNRKNRIIVNLGIKIYPDNTKPGFYYGWDEVGFIIMRVIK